MCLPSGQVNVLRIDEIQEHRTERYLLGSCIYSPAIINFLTLIFKVVSTNTHSLNRRQFQNSSLLQTLSFLAKNIRVWFIIMYSIANLVLQFK